MRNADVRCLLQHVFVDYPIVFRSSDIVNVLILEAFRAFASEATRSMKYMISNRQSFVGKNTRLHGSGQEAFERRNRIGAEAVLTHINAWSMSGLSVFSKASLTLIPQTNVLHPKLSIPVNTSHGPSTRQAIQ